ncbi:hypothetical protein B0H16DRAFT_1775147 [Mycena metata]|uniref:Uncharacterized protein n=1 Tax=Mycena metata TaxID=1033252 RepID=A0AAD7HYS0_9AGAR|nr:hypothetical protein B0H16DRAFT_1775147 [Mycena metata]
MSTLKLPTGHHLLESNPWRALPGHSDIIGGARCPTDPFLLFLNASSYYRAEKPDRSNPAPWRNSKKGGESNDAWVLRESNPRRALAPSKFTYEWLLFRARTSKLPSLQKEKRVRNHMAWVLRESNPRRALAGDTTDSNIIGGKSVWQCHLLSLPAMSSLDVAHAIALIQAAYAPSTPSSNGSTAIQTLQSTLLAAQRTPAAWALVVPLLSHPDPNVQFFGTHTAHAKIAHGELASLSAEEQAGLRGALVGLAGVQGRTRVVRRKVYSAVVALAIRSVGEGWVEGTVGALAGAGAPSAHIREFLAGAAEDVGSASLLPQPRIRIEQSLRAAAPLVLQSISSVPAAAVSGQVDVGPDALPWMKPWITNPQRISL